MTFGKADKSSTFKLYSLDLPPPQKKKSYWLYGLWVMLPVTTAVVLVTSDRSSRALATNRGIVIDWRDEGNVQAKTLELEGQRFKSCSGNEKILSRTYIRI